MQFPSEVELFAINFGMGVVIGTPMKITTEMASDVLTFPRWVVRRLGNMPSEVWICV